MSSLPPTPGVPRNPEDARSEGGAPSPGSRSRRRAALILDEDFERVVTRVLDAAREHEFATFVIGIEMPKDYSREEHEAAYRALKVRLGSRLCELWPGREVDFERPELRIELRTDRRGPGVVCQPMPLFIGGRYRKLSREIPACRWAHMRCKGRGCRECGFTGNICGPSIQEVAEPAVLAATAGEATFFHGAGREDIDVRMLGGGRPFVLEVQRPRRRTVDLTALTRDVNDAARGIAEVHRLALTTRDAMIAAKMCEAEKTYRAWVEIEGSIPPDAATRLAALDGAEIEQLSPTRVMKRRGVDTLRRKRIIGESIIGEDDGKLILEVRASSGTYIKELISGDDGRTRPSVASVLGVPCRCALLDVIDIHWTPPWESPPSEVSTAS